jgi:hypothetical protein
VMHIIQKNNPHRCRTSTCEEMISPPATQPRLSSAEQANSRSLISSAGGSTEGHCAPPCFIRSRITLFGLYLTWDSIGRRKTSAVGEMAVLGAWFRLRAAAVSSRFQRSRLGR